MAFWTVSWKPLSPHGKAHLQMSSTAPQLGLRTYGPQCPHPDRVRLRYLGGSCAPRLPKPILQKPPDCFDLWREPAAEGSAAFAADHFHPGFPYELHRLVALVAADGECLSFTITIFAVLPAHATLVLPGSF